MDRLPNPSTGQGAVPLQCVEFLMWSDDEELTWPSPNPRLKSRACQPKD